MSKSFSLREGNAGDHWHRSSTQFNSTDINRIVDPQGGRSDLLTSIPSPFAQMDLVRTALKEITQNASLNGRNNNNNELLKQIFDDNNSYNKIISDLLDTAELFFNYGNREVNDKIDILVWEKENNILRLKDSEFKAHQLFSEAIDLYLTQDSETFNFSELKAIYILRYEKNDEQILGATSPITLFFPAPGRKDYVDIKLTHKNSFYSEVVPFYKRDIEFRKYLIRTIKSFVNHSILFKELFDYIEMSNKLLPKNLAINITEVKKDDYEANYDSIEVKLDNNSSGVVEIFGKSILQQNDNEDSIDSDFIINTSKNVSKKPLVLFPSARLKKDGKPFKYYKNKLWDSDLHPGFVSKDQLNERILPAGIGKKYPYLLVSDFLEPYVIKMMFPVDDISFYNPNLKKSTESQEYGYLLPIKQKFFEYFRISDLKNGFAGKEIFRMEVLSGGIKVTLNIPLINDEFISLERIYYDDIEPDIQNNKGSVISYSFCLNIFPFVRCDGIKPHYRVQLLDREKKISKLRKSNAELSFIEDLTGKTIAMSSGIPKQRQDKDNIISTTYYAVEDNFEIIKFKNGDISGLIVPDMPNTSLGHDIYSFAVDFGTSNTHIEYRIGQDHPKAFEYTEDEKLLVSIMKKIDDGKFNADADIELFNIYKDDEFLPDSIGKGSMYRFPHRTSISEKKFNQESNNLFAFADMNIPFSYEKKIIKDSLITTNLKWSDFSINNSESKKNKDRIEVYFDSIMLLLRAKVLIGGGNLLNTKFMWFYPTSMLTGRRDTLQEAWLNSYKKYFNDNPNNNFASNGMSESIAPFYYYNENSVAGIDIKGATEPVISIDIGGGTTDIVVFENKIPKFTTSFKFAADHIFGDGFNSSNPEQNGFVVKYKQHFIDLFANASKGIPELISESLNKKSTDVISLFFSFNKNNDLQNYKDRDFAKLLKDDSAFKIIFLIFYSSIVYHISKILKANGIKMPRYMTFSGTGSGIIEIISMNMDRIKEFTRIIIEKAYGCEYQEESVEILRDGKPKEITAKGGIYGFSSADEQIKPKSVILIGTTDNKILTSESLFSEILECDKETKKMKVKDDVLDSVKEEVKSFLSDFLVTLEQEFNFKDKFIIKTTIDEVTPILTKNISQNINAGVMEKLKEIKGNVLNERFDETLFFYHFISVLPKLASFLYKKEKEA